MTRRPKPSQQAAVALFPFLAVLLCAMGSLILMLVVITRSQAEQARKAAMAAARPDPAITQAAFDQERDELEWEIEQLTASREKTAAQLAEQRAELSHLEEHAQRLRNQLAEIEAAERLFKEKTTLDEEAKEKIKQELADLLRKISETEAKLAEARAKGKRPPAFAIIPYQGEHGTRRRPIYIECRADSIVLQPEGTVFTEVDFSGSLGPSNPLASCIRVVAEHHARSGGMAAGEQPYPLLLVRPSGINTYYVALAAMKSWDSDFGYELIDENWPLEFPPSDPQLAQTLARTQDDARRRQVMIARAAPSLQSGPKPSFRSGPDGDGGEAVDGGGRYGSGPGRGGYAGGGRYPVANTGDGGRYPATPNAGGPDGAYGSSGGVPGGAAGAGGNLPGSSAPAGGPSGLPGGGEPLAAAAAAVGYPATSGSYGPTGGTGPAGAYGAPGGGYPGGAYPGNSTVGGAYPGSGAAGGGPGLTGSGSGESGGTPGPNGGLNGAGSGPSLGDPLAAAGGNGAAANQAGGSASGGDGNGANPATAANQTNGGNGPADGATTGNASLVGPRYANNGNTAGGQPMPIDGGGGSGAAPLNGGSYQAGPGGTASQGGATGGAAASGTASSGGPGGRSGSGTASAGSAFGSNQAAATSSGATGSGGGSMGQPSPTGGEASPQLLGEFRDKPAPGVRSLADSRGSNWGLPEHTRKATGLTRPVQIYCSGDRLTVMSDRGMPDKQINLGPYTADSVDELVSTVWTQVEGWGMAGRGMYWKPTLSMHVAPDGVTRYQELKALLAGSGLDVTGKQIAVSSPVQPSSRRR